MIDASRDMKEECLWRDYYECRTNESRNALMEFYWSWLHNVTAKRLRDSGCDRLIDDVFSFVTERVLCSAIPSFDPTAGVAARAWIYRHVGFAILDAMRAMDTLGRSRRLKAKQAEETEGQLAQRLCRRPTDSEVAGALGVQEEELLRILPVYVACGGAASGAQVNPTIGTASDVGDSDAATLLECAINVVACRTRNIHPLTENENFEDLLAPLDAIGRFVIWGYYGAGMTMRELGELFGLTESRISQKHAESLVKMRKRLEFRSQTSDSNN